jgi:3'-phosphoadenosine 5'-phosphosulfate (PAPS) 3'-phosphatase
VSPRDLQTLADQACLAATQAGAFITRSQKNLWEVRLKGPSGGHGLASQIVTEVDEQSEALILNHLAPTLSRYDLAVLTEEREDDRQRLEKDYFWCIDPLDGTLPFTRGNPGFAVSIALVRRDGVPVVGVVHDPVSGTLYRAVTGAGVVIDDVTFEPVRRTAGALTFHCDASFAEHPEREELIGLVELAAQKEGYTGVTVEAGAGAVLNACKVLTDGAACYFKKPKPDQGGGSLWDYAATACLFAEAGFHARDFAGQPLELNRPQSTFMNQRGICYASTSGIAAALHTP